MYQWWLAYKSIECCCYSFFGERKSERGRDVIDKSDDERHHQRHTKISTLWLNWNLNNFSILIFKYSWISIAKSWVFLFFICFFSLVTTYIYLSDWMIRIQSLNKIYILAWFVYTESKHRSFWHYLHGLDCLPIALCAAKHTHTHFEFDFIQKMKSTFFFFNRVGSQLDNHTTASMNVIMLKEDKE